MTDPQRRAAELLSAAAEEEAAAAQVRAVERMDGRLPVVVNGVELLVLDLRAVADRREKLAAELRALAAEALRVPACPSCGLRART